VQTFLHTDENGDEMDPEEILKLLNSSVVLLGQTINKVAYGRRLAVLAALTDVKTAKKDIKENIEDLGKEEKLFLGNFFKNK